MSDNNYAPLPSESVEDGQIRIWTTKQLRAYADATHALRADAVLPAQPVAMPDLTSAIVNDACWEFIRAMPHQLPAPVWNDLKPAVFAALQHFHAATTQPPTGAAS